MEKQYTEAEIWDYNQRMDIWREKHPFAAVIMSDLPSRDKVKYAEERFNDK